MPSTPTSLSSTSVAAATTTPPHSPSCVITPRTSSQLPLSPPRSTGRIVPTSAPSTSLTPPFPTLDGCTRCALQAIRRLSRGRRIPESRFRLSQNQFAALRHAIFGYDTPLRDWARDRLYYTYDAPTTELTLRMPGLLHEQFATELGFLFIRKFDDLRTNKATSEKEHGILNAIRLGGSARLELGEGSHREPDVCFMYKRAGSGFPPFVGEVGVAQDGMRDFARISEQYLLGSCGKIRTFLGVNIEYRSPEQRSTNQSPRRARVYLWHFETQQKSKGDHFVNVGLTVARCDENGVLFQNEDGVVDPLATIPFNLYDFCPRKRDDATSNSTFEITHQELANTLATAEEIAKQAEEDAELGSSDDDMPVEVVWRHEKRGASTELDEEDTEPNTPVDESSFEGPKTTDSVERRKSLRRMAKKTRT